MRGFILVVLSSADSGALLLTPFSSNSFLSVCFDTVVWLGLFCVRGGLTFYHDVTSPFIPS